MESISRISGFLETARDLTLEAARDAGSRRTSARPLPAQQIKKLLDSRHEREVLEGLRRVIAMQYTNPPQPTLAFFPSVVKTLSNPYPSTRPLVYNYLVHHAEGDPDTALLAINTIQKSLSDSNPRVRAMALKTMSGIKVPVISQIVSLAIKKGVNDLSPLVRRTAALSCVKCVRLDPGTKPQVEDYVAALLQDKQYYVAGAAVQAFMEICPDRLNIVHPVYRKLCRMVVDMDEWAQLAFLRLATVYARECFPKRTRRVKRKATTQEQRARDFYEDIDVPQVEHEDDFDEVEAVDPDLDLLLRSVQPLLQSRNSAVILAVSRLYLYLSPTSHLHLATGPLIALLRSPNDIQQVALYNIVQVCLVQPQLFVPFFRHFLLRSNEGSWTSRLKIEILTLVFPHAGKATQDLILAELEHFSQSHDSVLIRDSVRAIGQCAQSSVSRTSRRCLNLLLRQIHSPDQNLVGEAVEVVRHLIQRSPQEHRKTVVRLAKNLDTLNSPTARACVIWLVGEHSAHDADGNIAPDVLRILIKNYASESDKVRAQIVLLAAKAYLHFLNSTNTKRESLEAPGNLDGEHGETKGSDFGETHLSTDPSYPSAEKSTERADPAALLYDHTMLLARYTPSYDLRDRARLFRALLSIPSSTELASLLLLAPKPVPQAPSPSESRKSFALGSASLVIGPDAGGNGVKGHRALPAWVGDGDEPDPMLRDEKEGEKGAYAPVKVMTAGQKLDQTLEADAGYRTERATKKAKTLDDWLEEESGGEEEETEGESDEEGEEETGEEDTESDEDDGEEEDEDEEDFESEDEKAGLIRSK